MLASVDPDVLLGQMTDGRSNPRARISELAALTRRNTVRSTLAFLAIVAIVFSGLADTASTQERESSAELNAVDQKIARIRETANWRFVDKHFIETIEGR